MQPPRRTDHRAATRERLLRAARAHFEAHGFDGAHLRAIARDAEVALGTVFVHFRDKRDLLHAALFEDLERTLQCTLEGGPAELEPWLVHVTESLFGYYEARPALSRALLRESLLADEPWAQRFASQHARIHAEIVRRFEGPPAQAGLLGVAYLAFFNFALLAWAQKAHADPRGLVARLTHQHLRGGAS